MHMKRVLIASDDAHTRAWARSALDTLDITSREAAASDLPAVLSTDGVDLIVVDGGRDPEPVVQGVEEAMNIGLETRLFLLVEAGALPSLRLPARTAADFLVRGASSEELAARVRALLWPGEEASSQELLRIDHLTINLATYQAYLDGTPIDFTYLEYALFAFLVTHPNRAYSREILLQRVWGTDYYGGSRTVDVHIRRVRAKIGPELGKRLETVRNVGYLWNG
ncbi:MAG: response regulator transcription factor [Anaerosomatales bacterium]|nr:response regulator transcription factor [Anaerosomatales bacterium]MDT8434500.1 response regulator transcription factor [Anaerosomatales bacterium]